MNILFSIILLLNAIWLGMAFWFFSINSINVSKLLIKKEARQETSLPILTHSLKFLGGMNLALSILSLLILINDNIFPHTHQKAVFAFIFCLAHGSQFIFNLPIAINEYQQKPHLWRVLKGTMFFIFIIDFTLMSLNMFFFFYFSIY